MLILVDQDDVLADFDQAFLAGWRAQFPDAPFVPLAERRAFHIRDDYPEPWRSHVEDLYCQSGFLRALPPVPGSLDAVRQMQALGHEMYICTTPLVRYENCVLEKFEWVEQHLGRDFTRRLILTRDKTLVRGDLLIDDRPDIQGALTPEWEHVLFDRPYNRHVADKRRMDWRNWRSVLGL